jgi:20S proteasome alpha/beta subunit
VWPVTVCIAGIFQWNYGPLEAPKYAQAIVCASDRMMTLGDVEYEPNQLKAGKLTNNIIVLIAGDYTTHSEALNRTKSHVSKHPKISPVEVATFYGSAIQAIRRKQAEDKILAPLGLNTDTFLAQQKDMSDTFVHSISEQLQNFIGPEVEAIVAGVSDDGIANLYEVDNFGTARCFNDAGFAAIGIGAWHARSRLMQMKYINGFSYSPALAAIYRSKKAAEVAPGVGKTTDIILIVKSGPELLHFSMTQKLEEMYNEYSAAQKEAEGYSVQRIEEYLGEINANEIGKAQPTANVEHERNQDRKDQR